MMRLRSVAVGALWVILAVGCSGAEDDATLAQARSRCGPGQAWVPAGNAPADRYIVMLKPGASPQAVAKGAGARPTSVFSHAIHGFAADLPAAAASALANNPQVVSVTAVRAVQAFAQQVSTGLPRIGAVARLARA